MKREELLSLIERWEGKFQNLYKQANGTELQERIGLHIAEARLILNIEDKVSEEGLAEVYDRLVDNYYEIVEINSHNHYFEAKFTEEDLCD